MKYDKCTTRDDTVDATIKLACDKMKHISEEVNYQYAISGKMNALVNDVKPKKTQDIQQDPTTDALHQQYNRCLDAAVQAAIVSGA